MAIELALPDKTILGLLAAYSEAAMFLYRDGLLPYQKAVQLNLSSNVIAATLKANTSAVNPTFCNDDTTTHNVNYILMLSSGHWNATKKLQRYMQLLNPSLL